MTMEHLQRLVVRVSRGSISFSVADGLEVTFERYAIKSSISLAANMREALRTVPLLHQSFERVTVMVASPVMLMPADLYDKTELEPLYRYTYSQTEQLAVLSHVLSELNAVAVFGIHKDLRTVLTDGFGTTVHFRPAMASVWRHFYQRSFTGPRNKLYTYFHDQRVEVFSFVQNRFRFCNSYAVGSNLDDALFYMLSAWKQLGLDARDDELHLSGDIPDREQLTANVRRFIKRVFVVNPKGEFKRAAVSQIDDMPYDMMLMYLD